MMIVALTSKDDFKSKLSSILDAAKIKGETGIVIMTDKSWHDKIYNFMVDHNSVGKLKMAGQTFFIVKEMRIEIKPIDFYI